jgi:hypothetical protein
MKALDEESADILNSIFELIWERIEVKTLNDVVSKGSINVSLNKILDDDGYHPVFEIMIC